MQTVAVDVDGVLAQYGTWNGIDCIGDPIDGAVDFTRELSQDYRVLIYTARCTPGNNPGYSEQELAAKVRTWLDKHGFVYADIWSGKGKPAAIAYVDDRGVMCRPQEDGSAFKLAMELVRLRAKRPCAASKKK